MRILGQTRTDRGSSSHPSGPGRPLRGIWAFNLGEKAMCMKKTMMDKGVKRGRLRTCLCFTGWSDVAETQTSCKKILEKYHGGSQCVQRPECQAEETGAGCVGNGSC